MISSKDLTDEQLATIKNWAEEGAQLADIQKNLIEQFGLSATYMDTRFLVLDLGLELQSETPEEEEESEVVEPAPGEDTADSPAEPDAAPDPVGNVTVVVDEAIRPGSMVSGSVTFSDGERAIWLIDEMGRLGLDPTTPDYAPSEVDVNAFQDQLRRLLEA